ncbi:MAG: hypothetical protein AMXMBFR83_27130 [Phycisphaerae bacterium]
MTFRARSVNRSNINRSSGGPGKAKVRTRMATGKPAPGRGWRGWKVGHRWDPNLLRPFDPKTGPGLPRLAPSGKNAPRNPLTAGF